jgi:hypothetical protein
MRTDVAVRAIQRDKYELVDHEGKQYVTPPKLHVLRSIKSDRVVSVIQRVRGNPLKHIQPPTMLELD